MQQQRLRFRERLALFEQKNKLAPVLVKNRFVFCKTGSVVGKWATDFRKMSNRLWENQRPTSWKWATDFGEMSHRLWENEPPALGKSATDFRKMSHRLRENKPPTSGQSTTDFGKMSHRLWENQRPTSGKSATDFGKKWATDFGEMSFGDAWKFETNYFKKKLNIVT